MIEVWEKLDCESVGAVEIEAIETVILEEFGPSAVESPMTIARWLADEGAELRHSEIMALYVRRAEDRPYAAAFNDVDDFDDLDGALRSLRRLENLRRKYQADGDREGLRLVNGTAIAAKAAAVEMSSDRRRSPEERQMHHEIASWITVWLQTPEIFPTWVELRRASAEFRSKFTAE